MSLRPSASPARGGELARVQRLIAALPERCRRIFEMRKIEGLPQREIARRMGVSEHVVENESVRGLRAILAALAEGEGHQTAVEEVEQTWSNAKAPLTSRRKPSDGWFAPIRAS